MSSGERASQISTEAAALPGKLYYQKEFLFSCYSLLGVSDSVYGRVFAIVAGVVGGTRVELVEGQVERSKCFGIWPLLCRSLESPTTPV